MSLFQLIVHNIYGEIVLSYKTTVRTLKRMFGNLAIIGSESGKRTFPGNFFDIWAD